MKCQKCGLPMFSLFYGPAGIPSAHCKCFTTYTPAPNGAKGPGCTPLVPLTEADVRRIVREELDSNSRSK